MEEKNFESIFKIINIQIGEEKFYNFTRSMFNELSYKNINGIKIIDISAVEIFINLPLPLSDRFFKIIKNNKINDFFEEKEFLRLMNILYISDISVKIETFFKVFDIDNSNSISKKNMYLIFSHLTILSNNLIEQFFGRHNSLNYAEYLERLTIINCDLVLFFYYYIAEKRVFNENLINYFIKCVKENKENLSGTNESDNKINEIYPLKSILRNKKEKKCVNMTDIYYGENSFDDTDSGIKRNDITKTKSSYSYSNNLPGDSFTSKNKINLKEYQWKSSQNLNNIIHEFMNSVHGFNKKETIINDNDIDLLKLMSIDCSNCKKLDGNCTVTSNCIRNKLKKMNITNSKDDQNNFYFIDDKNVLKESDEDLKELEEFENDLTNTINKNMKVTLAIRPISQSELPQKAKTFKKQENFKDQSLFNFVIPLSSYNKEEIEEFDVYNKKYVPTKLVIFNDNFIFVFYKEIGDKFMLKHTIYLKCCFIKNKEKDELEIYLYNYKYHLFHFTLNNKEYFLHCINYNEKINQYQLLEEIDKNFNSRLIKATKSNTTYYLKVIYKKDTSSSQLRNMKYIYNFLITHPHKNIITIYDMYETLTMLYIIMEYIPYSPLGKKEMLSKIQSNYYESIVFQLLECTNYLHSFGILNRDIRLDNIFIYDNKDYSIKLVEFGKSIILSSLDYNEDFYGVTSFTAPEIFLKQPYGLKSDIWSIGIIIYIILYGKPPINKLLDIKNLKEVKFLFDELSQKISLINYRGSNNSILFEILQSTIVKSAIQRSTAEEILKHIYSK